MPSIARTCIVIFGSVAVFSIGPADGVSPAANSTLSEDSSIWGGGKIFFGGFLLVVFVAERASAFDWIRPFLFRFAGGGPGGLFSGIGEAFRLKNRYSGRTATMLAQRATDDATTHIPP
jgi:hypothetical protein